MIEEFNPPEDSEATHSPTPNGSGQYRPPPPPSQPREQSPWGGPAPRNISDDELASLGVNIR